MMRVGLALACATVLAACSSPDHPAAPTAAPAAMASSAVASAVPAAPVQPAALARYDGYGDMHFGMDEATFDRAWAGELKVTTPAAGSSCISKRPQWVKAPTDFAFMFEGGHFVRYDVGTAKEIAPGGGKVGMSEAQIGSLYGDRVVEQPHKYVAGAKNLRIAAAQGNAVLLFETDATGKVTRWRVGVPPQVDYVEGCG
ncbi:lectin [Rhodanobacter glycinis]|uniref:Lectin n=1 Tax=Rhodanobacter glycinis TaxID=582702 RepID=A0A502CEQ8_9GAMM|nr:lectin [Rhodanobacter glycinis]TPG11114.1 lectin [Rhodanobacter glycinis]